MVAIARIAATATIDQSYLPAGADVRRHYSATIRERSIVMPVSVCLCVCLCVCDCLPVSVSLKIRVRSLPILCARYLWPWLGSPLVALRYVMYFRFMDDVILAYKPRQLMEAQPTCSLGLGNKRRVGIPAAGQWTHIQGAYFSVAAVWAY